MSFTNYLDELYQNTVLHGPPEGNEEDAYDTGFEDMLDQDDEEDTYTFLETFEPEIND